MTRHRKWLECPKGRLFGVEEESSLSSELTRRPYTLHAASLVDPRRCKSLHMRTLPIVVALSCGARVPAS